MAAPKKTNAARVLDKLSIPYALNSYPVDLDDLSAGHVAESMGVDASCVFKTLVTRGNPNGIALGVVPGDAELSLKKLAAVFGNKNAEMVPLKDVLPLTGYIRGGCSPVGMKKQYPTVFHETAEIVDTIMVSAGKIGYQVELAPAALVELVGGSLCDITVL